MRTCNAVCGAVAVVLGCCGVVFADMVVYDHFDSPPSALNMTLWQLQDAPSTPAVSGSQVVVSGSGWQEINSSAAWDMRTTTFELEYHGGSGSQYLGIGNYPIVTTGYKSVILRNDFGGWKLYSNAVSGGDAFGALSSAPSVGDVFDFAYNAGTGNVDLYKNGDAAPIASVACDLSLIISPNKTMELYYGATGGSELRSDFAATGPMLPEPSAIVLLSMGVAGLLAYAWKKRG
jgi:hypothetical protein